MRQYSTHILKRRRTHFWKFGTPDESPDTVLLLEGFDSRICWIDGFREPIRLNRPEGCSCRYSRISKCALGAIVAQGMVIVDSSM